MFCILLSLLLIRNERTYINVGKGAKWSKIISGMIIGLGIAVQCIYSVSKKNHGAYFENIRNIMEGLSSC